MVAPLFLDFCGFLLKVTSVIDSKAYVDYISQLPQKTTDQKLSLVAERIFLVLQLLEITVLLPSVVAMTPLLAVPYMFRVYKYVKLSVGIADLGRRILPYIFTNPRKININQCIAMIFARVADYYHFASSLAESEIIQNTYENAAMIVQGLSIATLNSQAIINKVSQVARTVANVFRQYIVPSISSLCAEISNIFSNMMTTSAPPNPNPPVVVGSSVMLTVN